jgi:ATP-binding cassette subfamily F protein 3
LDEGTVVWGTGVEVAYFDQGLRCLSPDASGVDAIRPDGREMDEGARRSLLARFGLTGDTALQKVDSLSGGERNRAALARLAAAEANVLILDEPTNHLDLWARDSLENSLKKYEGTVLLVSHDRYFINQVADHLLVVEPGRFRAIEGNYDMYVHLVQRGLAGGEQNDSGQSDSRSDGQPAQDTKPQRSTTEKRKRKFPYRKVEDLEAEIFQREEELEQLHEQLTIPDILRDGKRVKQIQADIESHREVLATLYEHWEEASELNR